MVLISVYAARGLGQVANANPDQILQMLLEQATDLKLRHSLQLTHTPTHRSDETGVAFSFWNTLTYTNIY